MVRVAGTGPEESDLGYDYDIKLYRGTVLRCLWFGPAQVFIGRLMLYSRLMKTGGRLVVRGSILSAHSPAAVEMPSGRLCRDEAGDDLTRSRHRFGWLCCPPSTGLWPTPRGHRNVPARPDPTAASGRGGGLLGSSP